VMVIPCSVFRKLMPYSPLTPFDLFIVHSAVPT
jgi:hypothetical protein